MEVVKDPEPGTASELVLTLKCLLADEYVLMNKTSTCLLDPSSPFSNDNNAVFQSIYNDLKKSTEQIMEILRDRSNQVLVSINEILKNTQLKNSSLLKSRVAAIEILLDDHLKVIKFLDRAIEKFAHLSGDKSIQVFKALKDKHNITCVKLHKYLKEIFNY
jgi:DNA-binding ferritin-like protein